jgi:hypothetical protein
VRRIEGFELEVLNGLSQTSASSTHGDVYAALRPPPSS